MSKYVNPFTDFGFDKIFISEASKNEFIVFLDKYAPTFSQNPETAIKWYRDLYAVVYTAKCEEIGFKKAQLATAQKMSAEGFSKEIILKLTGIDPSTT